MGSLILIKRKKKKKVFIEIFHLTVGGHNKCCEPRKIERGQHESVTDARSHEKGKMNVADCARRGTIWYIVKREEGTGIWLLAHKL